MMGKSGHFTRSRSLGAFGSLHFVCVKFLKFFETGLRRCLCVPSITYGASNFVEVPICFRNCHKQKCAAIWDCVNSGGAAQLCSRLIWYEESQRPGVGESLDISRIEGKRRRSY